MKMNCVRGGEMNKINFRKEILNELIPYAEQDSKIILLAGDMGFGAIDRFQERFPDRVFNMGIMEQSLIGIAAGLAIAGMHPVVYTMVNFLAFRALEQVRIDLVKQNLNVKLIGTGANDYFDFLGYSHTCGQDDVEIMKVIGMPVFDPYADDSVRFQDLLREWMLMDQCAYIRV